MKATIILLTAILFFSSCKKDEVKTTPLASLTMVNAVSGGTTVKLGSNATTITNNGSSQMALIAGNNDLYVWPVGDSAHPYFTTLKFNAEERAVYSLFLCGTPGATEGLLLKENIPYRTDSTAGIRFINLSPNGLVLNITRNKTPTVNEVSNLNYKQFTAFMSYPGLYNSTDTFQIRNANTNAILATQVFSASTYPRFANITLVIRQSGAGVAVYRVNNDR